MRKRCRRFFPVIVAAICAAAVIGCGANTVKDGEAVMEIAGEKVVKEEYQMIIKSYRSQVKMQYQTSQANAEDFWRETYPQGTPLSQVMEFAREDLLHKKVLAKLARDAGVGQEADYLSLMEEMEEENKEREEKNSAGDPVYGLLSFEPEDYYKYVYTGLEVQVLEHLKKEYEVSEEDLKTMYQETYGGKEKGQEAPSFQEVTGELKSQRQTWLAQQEISKQEQGAQIQVNISQEQMEQLALEALED